MKKNTSQFKQVHLHILLLIMLLLHISSASAGDISIANNSDTTVGGSIITSDYLYFTLNKSGTIGNSSGFPGIQHNPQGLRVFDSTADYIKPGTPFEGFVVEANGIQYHNNNSLDFSSPQIGGLGYSNSSSSNSLNMTWTGKVDSFFEVIHNYSLSSTGQNLNITTTITALSDLNSTKFLRFIDPDQDQPVGTFGTNNTRGLLGSLSYPENNIVCGAGPIRTNLRVCLYSESSVTHNTGVSQAWTPIPSHYLTGTNDGNGNPVDYVIGLGFDTGNLSRGQSKTFKYSYLFSDTLDSLEELITFASLIYGPSAADTQSSMQYQSRQLRSAFNTQTVAANFALNYDCNLFDTKGMCISAGGRYTTIDNPGINNSAAVVTLGYKANPNIRVGAYLDQNVNISNPTGVDISNTTPLMGAYAVWNKEPSGLGYQVRLANTYQDKDVTSTRTVFNTSEAGSGKTSLKSQSYLAELSYAFQYQDKTLVRPYAGLRYTHLKQDGYTEGSVDNPLSIAALRDKGATALLGVKVNRSLTDKATLTAQLGLEQDVHHKVGNYSATNSNIGDLDSVAFNSNIKRTRPVASIGAFYDVTKTQRASATINYQQLPFQSTASATAYFNYMIGF